MKHKGMGLGLSVTLVLMAVTLLFSLNADAAVQALSVKPAAGFINSEVQLSVAELPAGADIDLVWQSYDVSWNLSMHEGVYSGTFSGRNVNKTETVLKTVTVGDDGKLATTLNIPDDIGGVHTIYVRKDGEDLAQGAFRTDIQAKVSPKSGPQGTPITIEVTGLDTQHYITGWYQVLYDNKLTGFMTAVTTKGTAKFTIPAVGRVGKHVIELQNAPFGSSYRALESSPYFWLPTPEFVFEITDGIPVLPTPIDDQWPSVTMNAKPQNSKAEAMIWTDVERGPVGTPMSVMGAGLPANTDVSLLMYSQQGSRVTAAGYTETSAEWEKVTTDANGAFQLQTEIPDGLGGIHKVTALVGEDELAMTHFAIAPTAYPLEPAEGPVGTTITMRMKGIGWSQTENIYAITYDNSFIGYACGFSTNGTVTVYLQATGEPGWHYIDIYPSFYRNHSYGEADESPFLYRFPILTWKDHPTPIRYRYAFKVTE